MSVPVITPASAVLRGKQTQLFTADQSVVWSAGVGAISAGGLYTAPNWTTADTVTAAAGAEQGHAPVAVTGVLGYDPDNGSEGETRRNVRASEGVHLRRWTQRRSPALRFLKLNFTNRPTTEFDDVYGLWDHCYPELPIYWHDAFFDQERKYYFDGPLTYVRTGRGSWDYKLSLREVALYVPGAGAAVAGPFPFVASYGQEVESAREVLLSDADDWSRAASAVAGTTKRRFEIVFHERGRAEVLAAESFWKYYFPNRAFAFHAGQGLTGEFKPDGPFSWTYQPGGVADYKFTVREA